MIEKQWTIRYVRKWEGVFNGAAYHSIFILYVVAFLSLWLKFLRYTGKCTYDSYVPLKDSSFQMQAKAFHKCISNSPFEESNPESPWKTTTVMPDTDCFSSGRKFCKGRVLRSWPLDFVSLSWEREGRSHTWVPVEEFLHLPDLLSPQVGYASEAGQPFLV